MPTLSDLRKGLHELVDNITDESALAICKQILEREQQKEQDLWDKLSEDEKAGIERGLGDVEAGNVYTYEEVKKFIKEQYDL